MTIFLTYYHPTVNHKHTRSAQLFNIQSSTWGWLVFHFLHLRFLLSLSIFYNQVKNIPIYLQLLLTHPRFDLLTKPAVQENLYRSRAHVGQNRKVFSTEGFHLYHIKLFQFFLHFKFFNSPQ
jgi:hypothetical protein